MNDGFINEELLVKYINNNYYNRYVDNIKNFLKFVFGLNFDETLPFRAEHVGGHIKPDLIINHNKVSKFISIKKGSGNSVHQEKCSLFFRYINDLLGHECATKLQLFHYGDDTVDDTGKHRYSAAECKKRYKEYISDLNKCINKWDILEKFLDRFLFIGNIAGKHQVDIIYHGTIEKGLWANINEIKDYIKENTFNSDTIHFGPLTYQVWGRNENKKAIHPERRYVMQIKWGNLKKDLINIRGLNNDK